MSTTEPREAQHELAHNEVFDAKQAATAAVERMLEFLDCKPPHSPIFYIALVPKDPGRPNDAAVYEALMENFGITHHEGVARDQYDPELGFLTYEDTIYRDRRGKIVRTVTPVNKDGSMEFIQFEVHKTLPEPSEIGQLAVVAANTY